MKARRLAAATAAIAVLVLAGCSKSTSPATNPSTAAPATSSAAAAGVTYTAHDFNFDGPDTLPAGTNAVTLSNAGAQQHELVMIQVDADHSSMTDEDVVNFVKNDPKARPKWATVVGGVFPPVKPGSTGSAAFGDFSNPGKPQIDPSGSLQPGTYFFMCFVTDPTTHLPHAAMGMVHKVTVS